MFYRFNQNNSYGKFLKPAREVIVEADSEAEALQVAETIEGIYFKGSSDRDCPCCGPRWSQWCLEYSDEEMQEYINEHKDFMSWLTPSIPQMIVRYKDGNVKVISNTQEKANDIPTLDAPVDTQMPVVMQDETQEYSESAETEN